MEARLVPVYATHTGTRDITERMEAILTRHWVQSRGDEGRRGAPGPPGFLGRRPGEGGCGLHPRLVQTGLDLVDFPHDCVV